MFSVMYVRRAAMQETIQGALLYAHVQCAEVLCHAKKTKSEHSEVSISTPASGNTACSMGNRLLQLAVHGQRALYLYKVIRARTSRARTPP